MSEERNEFTPDLFTLEDEDGNEQVFELLDVLEYEDNTYYALVPYYGDDEDALAQDDGEFVILPKKSMGKKCWFPSKKMQNMKPSETSSWNA